MAAAAEVMIVTATVPNGLNLKWDEADLRRKAYAQQHHIPIIQDEGLAFLEMVIRLIQPKRILEIGSAIGYSAIRMHQVCGSLVTTIESDPKMVSVAKEEIAQAGLSSQIRLVFKDALEAYSEVAEESYDLIFIDAAKAQYAKFFQIYTPLLKQGGVVVCDNMLFHGLLEENNEQQSRSLRGLVRKLSAFHQTLLEDERFQTSIFPIGDGMSVSVKTN